LFSILQIHLWMSFNNDNDWLCVQCPLLSRGAVFQEEQQGRLINRASAATVTYLEGFQSGLIDKHPNLCQTSASNVVGELIVFGVLHIVQLFNQTPEMIAIFIILWNTQSVLHNKAVLYRNEPRLPLLPCSLWTGPAILQLANWYGDGALRVQTAETRRDVQHSFKWRCSGEKFISCWEIEIGPIPEHVLCWVSI
jgi:hypothetical protein